MKTHVAETSLRAFHSLGIKAYLQPKEAAIMDAFKCNPKAQYTRQQLAAVIGMPLNCVCGRARSLLDKKALVVVGETFDAFTRKHRDLLGLPATQEALF